MAEFAALTGELLREAAALAHEAYLREEGHVRCLEEIGHSVIHETLVPMIGSPFAFAVFEDGRMQGFLAGDPETGEVPLYGHGADAEDTYKLYSLMYGELARRLDEKGIRRHMATVYRHDPQPLEAFFHNGFGMFMVHAAAGLGHEPENSLPEGFSIVEGDPSRLYGLRVKLASHLKESPSFLDCEPPSLTEWEEQLKTARHRLLALETCGRLVGYVEYCLEKARIAGAYLEPEYRGRGFFDSLVAAVFKDMAAGPSTCCHISFNSMNPPSTAFWLKYFRPYAYGLVRQL